VVSVRPGVTTKVIAFKSGISGSPVVEVTY
jgi:hypothetical protein